MFAGLVNVLYVAEGDQITEGQVLAEISSSAFLEMQQDYLAALSAQSLAKRNHLRNEELLKEGIISEKTFLFAQSEMKEAEASLYRARQSLEFSGLNNQQLSNLISSNQMKKNMIIKAPFDGVVLKQVVRTGEHVDEDVPLYHIGKLDPLWIEVHMPYDLRSAIQVGNKIVIEGSDVASEIITIGQMVHEDDQGILVRGLLESGQNDFIPGQYVNAALEQKIAGGNFYRIPTGSVIRSGNEVSLFVRNAGGFMLKSALIIADEGSSLVIDSDISASDQIVVSGIVTLKGMLEGLGSEE